MSFAQMLLNLNFVKKSEKNNIECNAAQKLNYADTTEMRKLGDILEKIAFSKTSNVSNCFAFSGFLALLQAVLHTGLHPVFKFVFTVFDDTEKGSTKKNL